MSYGSKRIFGFMGVAMLVFAACSPAAATPKPITPAPVTGAPATTAPAALSVVFIPKNINNPYFDAAAAGGKKAATELGGSFDQQGPSTASSDAQVPFIQDATTKKVKAIAISADDPNAIVPALQAAMAAGIKVVGYDSSPAKGAYNVFVNQTDFSLIGQAMADWACDLAPSCTGEIAILSATATATNQNAWIAAMKTARDVKRARRISRQVPSVVLAGYTNAGKSSLLNRLTDAGVLVENALFATLDPTVRRCQSSDGRPYTLADTVGFVRHLPTQLIEAFRSTLEEVAEADLILHVVDAADADPEAQIRAVHAVLADIDARGVPEQLVFNKIDAALPETLLRLRRLAPDAVFVSARTGDGVDELVRIIEARLPSPHIDVRVLLPYTRGDLVTRIHETAEVLDTEHTSEGTLLHARVSASLAAALEPYVCAAGVP